MKSAFHFLRVLAGIDSPNTQLTEPELTLLLGFSQKANVIVELGCCEGRTTVAMAESAPQAQVFSIDPFPHGKARIPYGKWIALLLCRRQGVRNVQLIRALSQQAVSEFTQTIDFLFIDGDHSYEAVRGDWNDWSPKVRAGGIIAMHDSKLTPSSPNQLGSMRFYREDLSQLERFEEVAAVDSLAIFRVKNGSANPG